MPPSTMASSVLSPVRSTEPLDNTIGAILIATFLTIGLYGLVVHQCYRYFQLYPKDSTWIKSLVVFTLVFETIHVVFSMHTCYYYLVTNYSHPDVLHSTVWSLASLGAVTLFAGMPSQIFFACRIFLLGSQKYRVLVALIFVLLAGEVGFLCAATIAAFRFRLFSEFQHHTWLFSAESATAFVADGFIAAVLVNLLRSKHTGGKQMDRILSTLILYTMNTGLLTGTMNFLATLFGLLYPNNLIWAGLGIIASKLYANSLLAALNTRNALKNSHTSVWISAGEFNALLASRRQETTDPSEPQFEVQHQVASLQKMDVTGDSQAFLTFELVGIAV